MLSGIGTLLFCGAVACPVAWMISEFENCCRLVRMCLDIAAFLSVTLLANLLWNVQMAAIGHHYSRMLWLLADESEHGNDDLQKNIWRNINRGGACRTEGCRLRISIKR